MRLFAHRMNGPHVPPLPPAPPTVPPTSALLSTAFGLPPPVNVFAPPLPSNTRQLSAARVRTANTTKPRQGFPTHAPRLQDARVTPVLNPAPTEQQVWVVLWPQCVSRLGRGGYF